MKFFLSSVAISPAQGKPFEQLIGKQPQNITMALIENAADPYGPVEWVVEYRDMIKAHGYQVELVDLREYKTSKTALKETLASKDVIWLGGGNVFYLRWILKDVGADVIIKKLVQGGVVYGGGSAGAVVAGPTLRYFEEADDPDQAPELMTKGLGLIETVVIPHLDNPKYTQAAKKIDDFLTQDGYTTQPLTDAQALVLFDEEEPKMIA